MPQRHRASRKGMAVSDFRYKAFISYSWADAAWGKWLHHALETYRTPKALIGKDTPLGRVPARLMPLFKDREEEAAGASIGGAVEAALASSEFLIVICSPNSARSQWVDHEIAWFKTYRDPRHILALIVDGEPGGGERECFPRALTHGVNPDLTISDTRVDAPLAADARPSGDGRRGARLKLAAAMLGVGLDELVRRDDRRRALRVRIVVGASLALALAMSTLALVAVRARDEAEFQRAQSDGLVEFMLTDLRERLEPVGRLDALDVVGQRALSYYAQQKPGNLDADALGRRSRALHLVGEVSNIRGDSSAGLKAFREAAATTAEQLARDPDNQQRTFDHAQSVFWVGYIAYERKETREAEAQFREYKRLADRLAKLDPNKPEWQMEVSYAETNLGVLLFGEGRYSEAEPAFTNALAKLETVAAREKTNPSRKLELGRIINWLGKARAGIKRFDDARGLHQREIEIYQAILRADPRNNEAKWLMSIALQSLGMLETVQGRSRASLKAYDKALLLIAQLRVADPANSEWRETEVRGMNSQASAQFYSGDPVSSQRMLAHAQDQLQAMMATDPSNRIWSIEMRSSLDVQQARLHLAQGRHAAALATAQAVLRRLETNGNLHSADMLNSYIAAGLLAGDALAALGRKQEASHVWQSLMASLPDGDGDLLFRFKRQRFQLLKRLGRTADAARVAAELEKQGDRHPAFLSEQ
jgi:tetratricopeptide (TPR) repeat protein